MKQKISCFYLIIYMQLDCVSAVNGHGSATTPKELLPTVTPNSATHCGSPRTEVLHVNHNEILSFGYITCQLVIVCRACANECNAVGAAALVADYPSQLKPHLKADSSPPSALLW